MAEVLCAANAKIKKYYFNPLFDKIPDEYQKKLQVLAVETAEKLDGIFIIRFNETDRPEFVTESVADEKKADEVIRELREKEETFMEQLTMFYKVFVLELKE